MDLAALRAQFRADADDQVANPYLFSDAQIASWLNEAVEEACIRASLLQEDEDAAVCTVAVTPGTASYPLHASVIDVTVASFTPTGGDRIDLELTDRIELDRLMPGWRTSTDDPAYLVQDDTKARIVPTPQAAGVLSIECVRLPLEPMSGDSDEPEIAQIHHRQLVNWALFRAFSKPDSETIDPTRAAKGESAFVTYFGIRPDAEIRKTYRANRAHHNQAIW